MISFYHNGGALCAPLALPLSEGRGATAPPVPHLGGVQLVPTSHIGSLVYQFWQNSKLQLPFVEKSRSKPGFLMAC